MKVVYVRESKTKGYTVLGINAGEGARAYTVNTSVWVRIGSPISSDVIDERSFAEVAFSDECFRATKKALSILAFAANNRRQLSEKLRRHGFSKDAIGEAVADMMRNGYIDERRQLARLIENEVNVNLLGRGRLVPKLVAKGYARADVEDVLSSLIESGDVDLDGAARTLVRKKLGDDPDAEAVKILLYKNGFSHGVDL